MSTYDRTVEDVLATGTLVDTLATCGIDFISGEPIMLIDASPLEWVDCP